MGWRMWTSTSGVKSQYLTRWCIFLRGRQGNEYSTIKEHKLTTCSHLSCHTFLYAPPPVLFWHIRFPFLWLNAGNTLWNSRKCFSALPTFMVPWEKINRCIYECSLDGITVYTEIQYVHKHNHRCWVCNYFFGQEKCITLHVASRRSFV